MTLDTKHKSISERRQNERGAALVMTLLVAGLILLVGGSLLMRSSMTSTTTLNSAAEAQAYYAAEAGMQAAVNVLRGNSSGSAVSFKEAATPSLSNQGGVSFPEARLSKWLSYTYPAGNPNRVVLDNGLGYSVKIIAPDVATPDTPPIPPTQMHDDNFKKPGISEKPPQPAWHPHHCGHCSWDYTHCGMWGGSDAASGTPGTNPYGCKHKHCVPMNWGGKAGHAGDDGFQRLIVQVTGYGPKGARKEMEMMIRRTLFQYEMATPLMIQGATPAGGGMTFTSSSNLKISGKDEVSKETEFPAIVFTRALDLAATNVINNSKDNIKENEPESFEAEEAWLESASEARLLVSDLRQIAVVMGRYYTSAPVNPNFGTDSAPIFTFIDGNATMTGKGAGLLVVTGTLTLSPKLEYRGLILVLGGGQVVGTTSTDSKIQGSMVIARFGTTGDFLAPTFNMGAGKLEMKANSGVFQTTIDTLGSKVVGVREF